MIFLPFSQSEIAAVGNRVFFVLATILFFGAAASFAMAQEKKLEAAAEIERTEAAAKSVGAHAAESAHAPAGAEHAADAHAAGHDETDLSHGNASPNLG